LFLAAVLAIAAHAQTPPPAPSPTTQTYRLPPEKREKAIEYAHARYRLHFVDAAYGMLVLAGVIYLRIAPRIRDRAEAISRRRIAQAYLFTVLLLLLIDIANLPIAMYGHHLSVKYEQSIQRWPSWFWDWTKGELISFAIVGVVVWILYGVIRRSPRRWWFWFWVAAVPMVIFLLFVSPLVIDPLFWRFEPLAQKQPALTAEIARVVRRGGLEIPPNHMFEMNASEKLNALNAYVTGIGASKRVVVWDTTIRRMNTGEILFVFGHEMGHYVLHHVWLGIAAACAGILFSLWIAWHLVQRLLPAWSIRGVDDWASLPVLMLIAAVLGFLGEPAGNSFSRMLEHNADVYGLEVIHGIVPDSPRAAANSFQILGEVGLSDPDPSPFIEFWLYDHPSIADRVKFAAEYNPWAPGQSPKYVR
jgi:Zn-dependent protease with chaperone function